MKCDCLKKLLATVAVFLFKLLVGGICDVTFGWVYQLAPTNIWLPIGPSKRLFAGLFLASFLFVGVYTLVSKAFEGLGVLQKGLLYGFCIWAAGVVPAMIGIYLFMKVNPVVIAYWTLSMLVLVPMQGALVAWILRGTDAGCCCIKKA